MSESVRELLALLERLQDDLTALAQTGEPPVDPKRINRLLATLEQACRSTIAFDSPAPTVGSCPLSPSDCTFHRD